MKRANHICTPLFVNQDLFGSSTWAMVSGNVIPVNQGLHIDVMVETSLMVSYGF